MATWAHFPEHLRDRIKDSCGGAGIGGVANTTANAAARRTSSPAEHLGLLLKTELSGFTLVPEYRFHPERRYRIDYAFPEQKVAIEFDGYRSHGISLSGFRDGLRRQNLLVLLGWRVLRYSILDLRDPDRIVREVRELLSRARTPAPELSEAGLTKPQK